MRPCLATKLHDLADASPTMMAAWDDNLHCRFANPAYRTWFGVEPATMLGTSLHALLGPRLFELNKPFIDAALRGQVQEFERVIPGPDGVTRTSLARYTPDLSGGHAGGFFVEVSDIGVYKAIEQSLTERVADLEQELVYLRHQLDPRAPRFDLASSAQTSATNNALTAQIAHELRNAFVPIANCVKLIELTRDDAEKSRKALKVMARQMALTTRLLDDLIDFSGIEAGVLSMKKRRVELRDVVEQALDMSLPSVEHAQHQLRLDLSNAPSKLFCDPDRLAQALCNLLTNACKYSPPHSEITLSATAADGHVRIEVADSGLGIPPDALKKVFDLFTQLPNSAESRRGGIGVGLALVKNIVQQHGGVVRAYSAGVGRGATFTILLPAAPLH